MITVQGLDTKKRYDVRVELYVGGQGLILN